ncbi:uncharacterized protein ARMOST_17697 [Armillaria ostoyae]|uniref:Uncharacterized protein n=1 Tax=Armillaria ostoyae TaxID=47428 RepID=A0A284RZQ7_ARMOS|nr:uncharacterized protein ARMOST_17697 [Armillaria ostoyae]
MCTCFTYMLFNSKIYNSDKSLPISISSSDDSHPNIPYSYEDNASRYLRKYPFLPYSLKYWAYHASELQHSMRDEIIAFLDSACCRKVAKIFHAVTVSESTNVPVRLHLAVDYGLLHITEVFLDQGDDPHQCETPLLVTAIKRENLQMVKLLLDRDEIDPTIPSSWDSGEQQTPLFYAAVWSSAQLLEILLQSDQVNVNHKDRYGSTALMRAVASGHISNVKILLKHPGIDILARDNNGTTAYICAFGHYDQEEPDYPDNEMIALLEKCGGRPKTDYEPTYQTAACLPNEQLYSDSGFRIPLDSSTMFPARDLTGPSPCYDTNGDPIYIGSTIFKRSVLPCKIGPHLRFLCSVPFHGHEIAHTAL